MSKDNERELTTLEYVVLGLIGTEPQSGYSIISAFNDEVYARWSASPGSIYPMLKRLEKRGIIAGELEVIHETRPRKMYRLTELGDVILGEWLRSAPDKFAVTEERDITLLRFLFAEKRLSREEVLCWLDEYDEALDSYEMMFRTQRSPDAEDWSVHQRLVVHAMLMELNMQRDWVSTARERLLAASLE